MDETVDDILDDALAYVHESRADLVRDELNRLRDLQAGVSEAVRRLPERMRQDARREGVTFEQRNAIDAWRLELEKALAAHDSCGQAQAGVPNGWAKKKIDEFRCSAGELRELGDDGSADVLEGLADDMQRALAAHSNEGCADSGGQSQEELHAIADDHARSVVNMFAERDYVLPDKFAGLIVADMRLLAERVSNAAAPQSERGKGQDDE